MHVEMVGIDHNKASLDYREAFSFTKAGVKEAVEEIKKRFQVKGCILLSTCNRTELWISRCDSKKLNRVSPYDMLCLIKNIGRGDYEEYFTEREDGEAVDHLLNMVCGFDSKIFGEDQIISQVREALQISRECGSADMCLEKVFQTALAAGKKVKTEIHMSNVSRSAAKDMIDILEERIGSVKGVECLVIGNGQMGKLVVNTMLAHGGRVSMTLRRKFHGRDEQESLMPKNCKMIPYDDRISEFGKNTVIVSATLSPHYTLKFEELEYILTKDGRDKFYLFDLAVPRDIDPRIGQCDNVELFDIDSMNSGGTGEENREQIDMALRILDEYKEELSKWFEFRSYVPRIKEIVQLVSEDTMQRFASRKESALSKSRRSTSRGTEQGMKEIDPEEAEAVENSVRKATAKLIYGLREQLPPKLWGQCLEALHKSAEKETLKH